MSKRPAYSQPPRDDVSLRIIGGRLRGRRLKYSGDPRTRPMKDRVREAVFNLVGPGIQGSHAIDLFAGTGALALESISRGAVRATAIERHFPTANLIRENARQLQVADRTDVFAGDTFIWARRLPDLGSEPLVVFCCPPYALYQERAADMRQLIESMLESLQPGGCLIVEADARLDFATLPQAEAWDVRSYPPAIVGRLQRP